MGPFLYQVKPYFILPYLVSGCEKLPVNVRTLSRISFPFAGLISNCVNQSLSQAEASHFESTEKSLFEKFDRRIKKNLLKKI